MLPAGRRSFRRPLAGSLFISQLSAIPDTVPIILAVE